jgi:hypothetical protein
VRLSIGRDRHRASTQARAQRWRDRYDCEEGLVTSASTVAAASVVVCGALVIGHLAGVSAKYSWLNASASVLVC